MVGLLMCAYICITVGEPVIKRGRIRIPLTSLTLEQSSRTIQNLLAYYMYITNNFIRNIYRIENDQLSTNRKTSLGLLLVKQIEVESLKSIQTFIMYEGSYWKQIGVGLLMCAYICITVGETVIKRGRIRIPLTSLTLEYFTEFYFSWLIKFLINSCFHIGRVMIHNITATFSSFN
jgi:hypothetical protein